ncbi:biogenesis of lysosome-related organelles complex 1 subunit 1 isoform X1 [Mesocricetus auratus]|uniref:Biogenesis of lysosome-related organelles complex 1 subunit 1 n=1 Tax=Mesocricetus auratus TaxID=10036 RepID=A0ABM2Y6W6_MESAU|nr:biogenesis of lysosome-related organelles complex 1 subunit 1 isoform X1 [Mesocricetus auratus]
MSPLKNRSPLPNPPLPSFRHSLPATQRLGEGGSCHVTLSSRDSVLREPRHYPAPAARGRGPLCPHRSRFDHAVPLAQRTPGQAERTQGAAGVAQAYMNQRKLDHEVKTLQVQAAQFAKQTGQWIGMVENFNQALKEIGDVENWARSIELDMRTIATALEYVYKGQLQSAPS